MDKTKKFCYLGRYFDNEKDFYAYIAEYANRQWAHIDIDREFDLLKQQVLLNFMNLGITISNKRLSAIVNEAFLFIVKEASKSNE